MNNTPTYCAACGAGFDCKPDDIQHCGCYTIVLPDAAKEWMAQHYTGCLCTKCLLSIKKKFEEGNVI